MRHTDFFFTWGIATTLMILTFFAKPRADELVNNCCVTGFSIEKPVHDSAALKRITDKIGNVRTEWTPYGLSYRLNEGIEANYTFSYHSRAYAISANDTVTVLRDGRIEKLVFTEEGLIHLYSIGSGSWTAPKAAREVSNFLTNAYLLETGAIRFDSAQSLNHPPLKPDAEFWKRNLISQGWGAQYIYSGNPYGKNGWLPIGFGYLLDAALYTGAVAVAIYGDRPQDRIGAPFAMLGFSMLFKVGLNGLVAKGHMDTYNRLVGSGYPIPKTRWNGLSKARFGHYRDEEILIRHVRPAPRIAPPPERSQDKARP